MQKNAMAEKQDSTAAVEIENLSLTYDAADEAVHALSDINLRIGRGDFVSLIGPSGCGKTTLLRLVADLEQPTAGAVLVDGIPPREARLARRYGFVFQSPALYPWRTVERNVALPLEVFGLNRAERMRRTDKYLALVGLEEFKKKYPWQLSGGMQQRASIARALGFDPAILLMDEPFGALDEITRDRLNMELLSIWRKTGKTVIFVTHSIPEAVFLSTRIVVMSPRPGRISDVIDCRLPSERGPEIRESAAFLEIAKRVRRGLISGESNGG